MASGNESRLPKFKKLAAGGDIYEWMSQLQFHFEALSLWDHVSSGAEIVLKEGDTEETRATKRAICKRDMILSLESELSVAVRHLESADQMLERVRKMFVGSILSQKTRIRADLAKLTFQHDYFIFMITYQPLVAQLRSFNGVFSDKALSMQFLEKLPRSLALITHGLKEHEENAEINEQDVWIHSYDGILNYLIDTGLFDASRKQLKKERQEQKVLLSRKTKKKPLDKSTLRCHKCKKPGHFRRECLLNYIPDKEASAEK
eukprot:snap_masked-scaffold_28-processed-gene-4.22-mRNA-1 protein AED:1.00 eAED:1.00 QI:0/-1/0/0/-1/1/1/0/260